MTYFLSLDKIIRNHTYNISWIAFRFIVTSFIPPFLKSYAGQKNWISMAQTLCSNLLRKKWCR